MAVTEQVFLPIGDPGGPSSGETLFNFTFEYIQESDVKVSLDGVDTTAYTFANASTIQFNTAPADGVIVRIYRDTNIDTAAAVFASGSVIRAQDLNNNFDQTRFVVQEIDNNSWDNETDTIKTTNPWISSDEKVATTAAIDARFQDELNDTLDSNEAWVSSDNYIATTASIDQRIDTAITNDIAGSDGISITDDGDGTITVGISANSVDLDRIKNEDIITYAEQEAGNSWLSDTRIPTTFAAARRFDTLVQPTTPTGSNWAVGKTWLQNDQDLTVSVWNGSAWLAVASGGAFTNQPKVVYVDATAGDDGNDGHRISRPKQTIKAAINQINSDATYGDGSVVIVAPGVYQEVAPIDITKKDVSIIGTALRSCIIHPTPATEENSLFRVNSGTFLQNLTLTGVKASGVRGAAGSIDPDGTYGLPPSQGWNVSFYPGAMIYKSPYIQNCTNFSDSEIDNANLNAHTPAGGSAGDTDSAPTGGGLLIDGSVVNSNSPLRSMVCDSYTHVGLDGPGILVTNNGYCQATSSYAFFNHYHIKCLNGGQANLAASTTDFGRYGLIADGRSTTAIFTATTTANAADQAITFTIGAPVAGANWHGTATRPQGNMLVDIGGNTYPILSATANGAGWDVTISRPNPADRTQNLGLDGAVASGSAVSFYLRSMVASSGHTMEYCGSGTNYSALPENGGVPVDAAQIVELNDGKIWTAITDQNGKFKLGNFFVVDQQSNSLSVAVGSFPLDLSTLAVDPSGNALLGANLDLNGNSLLDGTGNVSINDVLTMNSNKIINVAEPSSAQDAATKNYVDTTTVSLNGDTMTGALGVPVGSAASPSIYFDANTGVYSPGADQLALSTNGTGRLFVDSSGRVGVGTSSPDIFGVHAIQASESVYFKADSSAVSTLYGSASTLGAGLLGTFSNHALSFYTNSSERLRITSAGLVGIGTSSVSNTLDIRATSANVGVRSTTSGLNQYIFFSNTADSTNGVITHTGSELRLQQQDNVSGSRITFYTKDSERVRIDDQGRLGINTQSPAYALDCSSSGETAIRVDSAASYNAALRFSQAGTNKAFINYQNGGGLTFGPAGSEAARLDASGRLLVGTSSPSATSNGTWTKLEISNQDAPCALDVTRNDQTIAANTTIGLVRFLNNDDGGFQECASIQAVSDGDFANNDKPTRLVFSTTADGASSPTERMRITRDGRTSITSAENTWRALTVTNSANVSGNGGIYSYLGSNTNDTSSYHFIGSTGGPDRIYIYGNGNIVNQNNSYGSLSDSKLKENIVDAGSQWSDIKALQVRKYNFKEGQTHTQIGLIAQEVELVSPGLVTESPDRDEDGNALGTVTKSVNYSVLYMKAVKALQEAMERIETLEAKVAALETP